jgi:hypothetical protein
VNYFSHAIDFLDAPAFVAGTCLPDWIRVVEKRQRISSKAAKKYLDEHTKNLPFAEQQLCRGILQHHFDDHWFHQTSTFHQLNYQFSQELQRLLGADSSMRPNFVGHIAIELLLDALLIEQAPEKLRRFYRLVESLDRDWVQSTVEKILNKPVAKLSRWIRRFAVERFLYDYLDNRRLLIRLNQIMKRVNLPPLPPTTVLWLADARIEVLRNQRQLLARPMEESL